jgi:hypothetical protein
MSLINDALKRANSEKARNPQVPPPSPNVPAMQPVETPPPSSVLPWAVMLLGVAVLAIAAVLWFRGGSQPIKQVAQAPTAQTSTAPMPVTKTAEPAGAASAAITKSPDTQNQLATTSASTASAAPVKTPPQSAVETPVTTVATQTAQPTSSTPQAVVTKPAVATQTPPAPVQTAPVTTAEATAEPQTQAPSVAAATQAPAVAEPPKSIQPRLQAIYYRFRSPTVVINGKTLRTGQSVDGIQVVSIQRTSVEIQQDGKYRTLTLE